MENSTSNVNASFPPNTSANDYCNPYLALDPLRVSDQLFMITEYAFLLVSGLIGNLFVIAVFYKRYDQLQTPVNYFIVNMAASDLLVPLFVLPRNIQEVYLGWYPWLLGGVIGDILCRVVHFADEVSVTVSSQSMVFIAAERFWSIVFPMKSPLISQRSASKFICFTWTFSAMFYFYYFFAYALDHNNKGNPLCSYKLPQIFNTWEDLWRVDRLSLLVIFVVIPFILMTIFYTAIIISLGQQENNASHLSSVAQQRRAKENRRITLMLVTVVILFFISWTPYYIYFFVQYYSLGSHWSCQSIKRLYLSSRYMNYIYTAVNPLIYYTFNTNYRQGFHQLLCCSWSCTSGCRQSMRRQREGSGAPKNCHPSVKCPDQEAELEIRVISQRQN